MCVCSGVWLYIYRSAFICLLVCGPVPDSFIDIGNSVLTVSQSSQDQIQLAADFMTYHVFDITGLATGVIWHNHVSSTRCQNAFLSYTPNVYHLTTVICTSSIITFLAN